MTELDLVTRLVRARDLTPGTVIIQDHIDYRTGQTRPEQVTVLDVETHPTLAGEQVTTGIGMDETGEQVRLGWSDWAIVRVVVSP